MALQPVVRTHTNLADRIAEFAGAEATKVATETQASLEAQGYVAVQLGRATVKDLQENDMSIPAVIDGARKYEASAAVSNMMLEFDNTLANEGQEWSTARWHQHMQKALTEVNTGDATTDRMVQTQMAQQMGEFAQRHLRANRAWAEDKAVREYRNASQNALNWNRRRYESGELSGNDYIAMAKSIADSIQNLPFAKRSAALVDVAASMLRDGNDVFDVAVKWADVPLTEEEQNKLREARAAFGRIRSGELEGQELWGRYISGSRMADNDVVKALQWGSTFVMPTDLPKMRERYPGMADPDLMLLWRLDKWNQTKQADPEMSDMLAKTLNFSVDPADPASRNAFMQRMQVAQAAFDINSVQFNTLAGRDAQQFHMWRDLLKFGTPEQAMNELHRIREIEASGRAVTMDEQEMRGAASNIAKSNYHSYIPFADSVNDAGRGEINEAIYQRMGYLRRQYPSRTAASLAEQAAQEVGGRYTQVGDRLVYTGSNTLLGILGGNDIETANRFMQDMPKEEFRKALGVGDYLFAPGVDYSYHFDSAGNMIAWASSGGNGFPTTITRSELRKLYSKYNSDELKAMRERNDMLKPGEGTPVRRGDNKYWPTDDAAQEALRAVYGGNNAN